LDLARRVTALLAVLLLLLPSVGEAMGHGCPHHGAGAAEHAAAMADALHADAGHDPAPAGHAGPRTCEGMCQTGSLPGLPAAPAQVLPSESPDAALPSAMEGEGRARLPAFFLPYAQGPPPGR